MLVFRWVVSAGLWVSAVCAADFGDLLWDYETGDSVSSSPTIDTAGNLYFGSLDGYFYSLDRLGDLRWRYEAGDWIDSSPALSPDESVVYVGTWGNRLLALAVESGAFLWQYETGSLVYASPAVAEDGRVFFGSSDGSLYALEPTGSLSWTYEIGGDLDSSPAIDTAGNVYVGSSAGFLVSVDATGQERWTWEVPAESGAAARSTGIVSTPMLTSDGRVLVGCQNYYVYCLDASSGEVLWKYETGGILESSVVEGMGRSCLVSGRDGYLYSFSWDGELSWRSFLGANYYSSPCVDGMGRIYVGALSSETQGALLALNSEGGILWRYELSSFVDSSPLLAADGTLYVGNNDGRLYAFEGGDKLASLGWSSFRGGIRQRGTLQGYTDLTGVASELRLGWLEMDENGKLFASYEVAEGGPIPVRIGGLGPNLLPVEGQSRHVISLQGSSGEMARIEAPAASEDPLAGSIGGWLEPGSYMVEISDAGPSPESFFLEVKVF